MEGTAVLSAKFTASTVYSNASSFVSQLAYLRKQKIEMNWRVNPVKASKILKGHDDHVITCLQFCGSKIVSGSDDNTLKVWSVATGKVSILASNNDRNEMR